MKRLLMIKFVLLQIEENELRGKGQRRGKRQRRGKGQPRGKGQ